MGTQTDIWLLLRQTFGYSDIHLATQTDIWLPRHTFGYPDRHLGDIVLCGDDETDMTEYLETWRKV